MRGRAVLGKKRLRMTTKITTHSNIRKSWSLLFNLSETAMAKGKKKKTPASIGMQKS